MKKSCEEISQMLVDYSDGKLSADESREVEYHLADCGNCHRMVEALRRTLRLTEVIWEDGLTNLETIHVPLPQRKRKIHWLRYAAVAAAIFIVVITSFVLRKPPTLVEVKEPSFIEIERKINDSASAARLLAATQLLAEFPDAKTIVNQQYRYIIEKYPETSAAAEAKLKMQ